MKLTELGYPVLSDDLHEKVFGKEQRPEMSRLSVDRAANLLGQFNVSVPVDHPENLYDGSLPLPELKGDFLREHFDAIAGQQIGHYKLLGDNFAKAALPPLPPMSEVRFEPGWVRYERVENEAAGGWYIEHVDFPLEEAFTFDTETFVQGGSFPIIGTALSDKAAYLWLAKELIDPTIHEDDWDSHGLIPIGENRFIAGHNISYDRVRAQEGYDLNRTKPENFYIDTLSAHVGVSGLAGGQRWLYVLAAKDPENLTPEERRKLRYAPKWLDEGSTNSLVACYNYYVYEVKKYFGDETVKALTASDKKVRDIFVKAENLSQIRQLLTPAVEYALNDAYYTAELFQSLWPKYLDSTPTLTALCGHYHLNGSLIPLVPDWGNWIEGTEKVYKEHNDEMTALCKKLAVAAFETWSSFESDEERDAWLNSDPWLSQLNWGVASQRGKYANIPNWYRPFVKDPDQHIGVKSDLAHLVLNLKWEGQPMQLTKDDGWCYLNPETGHLDKLPHPKGKGDNVGGVFSKDFVKDMEVGRLSSDLPEAKRALEIANATSYWTSVRKRVMDRVFLRAVNPHGEDALVTLPEILCHGTVTRRTVESLMVTMCSTKSWRIGTELKTRVHAPDGWKIVGADFDGQEMQIASIYSDHWEGGHVGCSPFGYNVLSGSKELGTDPHSALAKLCGIDRDTAKIVGFAILYGAGARAVQTYIRQKYPEKSPEEVKEIAFKLLRSKKGALKKGLYEDGLDSGCFNYMEEIAMRSRVPQLPCLGTKISTAMRPSAVGDDFKTSRVNWTIQSSGAEILSIFLTSVHWLAEEYKIPCRFILSIHDEMWFMTPERYAEQFAVVFQIAHMYTWALFHSAVGIPDLPLSRAFFSSVAIDDRLRKKPTERTVTPSNPGGDDEPHGVEYSMAQLAERGALAKLQTRYNAILQGLI